MREFEMYVVYNFKRGYLRATGPFHYPAWTSYVDQASKFSWMQAHAYANAYEGEVRGG